MISKSGYNWNDIKQVRFYVQISDPNISYKVDTAYFTPSSSIILDNGPNQLNNYDFEIDLKSAIGRGWYSQYQTDQLELVVDPR